MLFSTHWAATERLAPEVAERRRGTPIERVVGRIFREAGASVRQNVFSKDMNVQVAAEDARRIEVLAQNLPCYGGAQLAIDVTSTGVDRTR